MTSNLFNKRNAILAAAVLLYCVLYFAMSLTTLQSSGAATKFFVNDTVITKVNVTNYAPKVVGVRFNDATIEAASQIDLVAASTVKVWCNATVIDSNGANDIVAVNSTIFFSGGGNKSTNQNDNNEHYSNKSCAILHTYAYNKTVSCTFNVWYYANNGTWTCNMSAWDNASANLHGVSGYNSSTNTSLVTQLYALNTQAVLNFGELSLNTESATETAMNVTNIGNIKLNLRAFTYGGTLPYGTQTENNLSFKCRIGTINNTQLRYDLTPKTLNTWASMTPISGQFHNPTSIALLIRQRKSEVLNSSNATSWKVKIPPYGVKGQCNGTLVLEAAFGAAG